MGPRKSNIRHSGPRHDASFMMRGTEGRALQCVWYKEKHHMTTCPIFLGLKTPARWEGALFVKGALTGQENAIIELGAMQWAVAAAIITYCT